MMTELSHSRIEEPRPCSFPRCSFVPIGDSGELDARHVYCMHCKDTVHLFAEIVAHSRFGSCRNCGYRHIIGVKENGFVELHDAQGNFVLGIGGAV